MRMKTGKIHPMFGASIDEGEHKPRKCLGIQFNASRCMSRGN